MAKQGLEEFNPKNLPNEKFGKCQYDEHDDLADEPKKECKLRLMMYFSGEYVFDWMERDKLGLSDDEFDELYDKYEKVKWKSDSEIYCCENCAEALQDF